MAGEDGKQLPEHACIQMNMLKKALDGKVGSSSERQEQFLQEFSNLQRERDDQLNDLSQSNKTMKQVNY